MSESGRAVVLRYYREVWEAARPEAADGLFGEGYVNHAGSRGTMKGPAGIRANYAGLLAAFPDVVFELNDVLAEGEKVVVRYTMRGTHKGTFQGIEPTGRAVTVPGIGIYRVAEGKIQESWVMRDSLALLQQLGKPGL